MTVWTLVLAAGSSSRYGRVLPKQYERLHGRRVIDWSLEHARAVSDGIVLVVGEEFAHRAEPLADTVVVGGAARSDSVRAGLAVVPPDADVILVHDAARPLAGAALFGSVVAAVRSGADAAIPVLAVTDTIKRVVDGRVVDTLDRRELVAVQTPQGFRASVLRAAHAAAPDATDDAALVEAIGGTVLTVPGEPTNLKITYPHDLSVAAAYLA